MFAGKPIIGIVGGIGSGKSFIARIFGELGCRVIDSDAQVREAYRDPQVRETLVGWWGPEVIREGEVDRAFIARKVFADSAERQRLEQLLHPMVKAAREQEMATAGGEANVVAFVWDTPLLFEAGLAELCDVVVFVDVPRETRLERVRQSRGWGPDELAKRENLQWPLDKKRKISDHSLSNTADAAYAREQVRALLPRILAKSIAKADRR
ncbi:MAG: dephospho-CoA kinase [Phycisphaerales bacterium]|nr:dephospho-CoA kinase [Phycisphaerales bacterium]